MLALGAQVEPFYCRNKGLSPLKQIGVLIMRISSVLRVSLSSALILLLLPSPSGAAEVVETPALTTVFVLEAPVSLDVVAAAMKNVGVRPVGFDHMGTTRGGFVNPSLPLAEAVQAYRIGYVALKSEEANLSDVKSRSAALVGNGVTRNPRSGQWVVTKSAEAVSSDTGTTESLVDEEPQIFSFRVEGALNSAELGTLGDQVTDRAVIPATLNVAVFPHSADGPSIAVVEDESISEPEQTEASSGSKEHPWLPDYGFLEALETSDPETPRTIHQMLAWTAQSSVDAFPVEDTYEHNLVLYNDEIEGRGRPICDQDQQNDFWANRDGFTWSSSFEAEVGPYPDTEATDDCTTMDLTIGLYHPSALNAGEEYHTYIRTTGETTVEQSSFNLYGQRSPNNCSRVVPGAIDHQLCVGTFARGEGGILISRDLGCSLPGYFEWVADTPSASCNTGTTSKVSIDSSGGQHNGYIVWASSISATGRFASFSSDATNLASQDLDTDYDAFLHDRANGTTQLISQSTSGVAGNGPSLNSSVSADGRYVVFNSYATNLADGVVDNNGTWTGDVFLRDRVLGTTKMISSTADAQSGNHESYGGLISDDGRFVTFYSHASDLVAGDSNICYFGGGAPGPCPDVYMYEVATETISRVSMGLDGAEPDEASYDCAISSNGRYVVLRSAASNLVSGDSNGVADVFVVDTVAGTTQRASLGALASELGSLATVQGDGESWCGDVSDSGRYVSFGSSSTNLLAEDTNGVGDVFVRDLLGAKTYLVSKSSGGDPGNADSYLNTISGDGSRVAFGSDATNLVVGDYEWMSDVFVRDVFGGLLRQANVSSLGVPGEYGGTMALISGDGAHVAFDSVSENLSIGDTNSEDDVFVRDML